MTSVPVGGQIRYSIMFLDENGWTVGGGSTKLLDNFDPTSLPVPEITIAELAPPLSSGSSFTRRWTSQYDTTASTYSWSTAATVPGTIADEQSCDGPDDICEAGSIAVGTATGYIGYTYRNQDSWFVRQLGIANPGVGAQNIATPFAEEPLVLYDSIGQDAAQGHNFLLDPVPGANAYHVRKLDLTAAGLGLDTTTSWGLFLDTLHGVVLHPAGYLVGFNTDTGKLHVLQLPAAGTTEDLATQATMHAGTGNASGAWPDSPSGPSSWPSPSTAWCSSSSRRPVASRPSTCTAIQRSTSRQRRAPLELLPPVTRPEHLPRAVGRRQRLPLRAVVRQRRVRSIPVRRRRYQPTGEHVFQASGVNGASFVVDYWRNVYTQNFTPAQQTSGGVYLTGQGVAEPSTRRNPDTPNPGGPG